MNGLAIAREVADEIGVEATDDLLGVIMWEFTGWPSFFDGDPETVFRQQVAAALTPGDTQ